MAKKSSKEQKNFESYLKEIEEIVERLESGEADLDEAIALYEKGVKLSDACTESLKDAKLKIEVLKKKTGKSIETEDLDNDPSTDSEYEEDDDPSTGSGYDDEEDEDDDGDGTLPF